VALRGLTGDWVGNMETVLLTVPPGIAPRTREGNWGIVMLHISGQDKKVQWFEYRPSIYDKTVRAEWPVGTMMAAIPAAVAEVLVDHGYARVMTLDEAKAFNKKVERHTDETSGIQLNVS
jgi:hypothetical protein